MRRCRFWAWTLTLTAALLAVVWVGSMKVSVWVRITPHLGVAWFGGVCTITLLERSTPNAPPTARLGASNVRITDWNASFSFDRTEILLQNRRATSYRLPLWPFVLLTGVPGVWMLVKSRKHTNPHACPACGYDRTGLPQSSIGPAPCPECGKT